MQKTTPNDEKDVRESGKRAIGITAFLLAGMAVLLLATIKPTLPALSPAYKLVFLNVTASLPRGLYIRIPSWSLQKGDYVVYAPTPQTEELLRDRGWIGKDGFLLKKIGALAQESYTVNPATQQFSISGKYIGQAFDADREGNRVPVEYGEHIVPRGSFLPIGTAPRSFDGRYTGTVRLENIRAKVIPLITE